MKKDRDGQKKHFDIKSILTLMLVATLCFAAVYVIVGKNVADTVQSGMLDLFKVVVTAAVTYFFTRKSTSSIHMQDGVQEEEFNTEEEHK